jgi:hypothetical protein
MPNHHKTSLLFKLGSAFFAFLLWGAWAYHTNGDSIKAGIVQGVASLVITLVMVNAITWQVNRLNTKFLKICLPAVFTTTGTSFCLIMLHELAHTKNILQTIAPALFVGFVFCLVTSYSLSKKSLSESDINYGNPRK